MAPLRLLTYCCVYLFACVFYVTSDLVWTLNWTSGPIFTLSSCLLIPTQSSHLPFEPAVPLTAKLFLNTLHELSFFFVFVFCLYPTIPGSAALHYFPYPIHLWCELYTGIAITPSHKTCALMTDVYTFSVAGAAIPYCPLSIYFIWISKVVKKKNRWIMKPTQTWAQFQTSFVWLLWNPDSCIWNYMNNRYLVGLPLSEVHKSTYLYITSILLRMKCCLGVYPLSYLHPTNSTCLS